MLNVVLSTAAEFEPTAQGSIVPKGSKAELVWAEGKFTEGPTLGPNGSIYFRPYKIVKGGVRDDTNHTWGLSVSIDEFMGSTRTLTVGYIHEENHSTGINENYINDSVSIELLCLFF